MRSKTAIMVFLAFLVAWGTGGTTHRTIQHRFYESPPCGVQNIPQDSSWKAPSSSPGSIILTFENVNNPDMQACMNQAAKYWAQIISNATPIHISVSYLEDLKEELAVCDVVFFEQTPTSMVPSALYAQQKAIESTPESPDAYIWLNPVKQWDSNIGNDVTTTSNNLYTITLRSLAVCLGFGSSVTSYDGTTPCFQWDGHLSAFDRLIVDSNGKKLEDCTHSDYELRQFVSPYGTTNVYAGKSDIKHKMYTPSTYRMRESLVYLDNIHSLMHYGLGKGDCNFQIDNVTAELMSMIGWNVPINLAGQITCSNIDELGSISAYVSNFFSAEYEISTAVEAYNWEFLLFSEKDNSPITIQTSNQERFQVEPINDVYGFQENPDGTLRGEVRLSISAGGKTYQLSPLSLSLSLQPHFKTISLIGYDYYDEYSYELYYAIECLGVRNFSICIMEMTNPVYKVLDIKATAHDHITITNLDRSDSVELEFSATNSHGTITVSQTVDPNRIICQLDNPLCHLSFEKHKDHEEIVNLSYINVYDSNSNFIAKGRTYDELIRILPPGQYFFHYYHNGELVKMRMVVIQWH